jgi:hypothetical protein
VRFVSQQNSLSVKVESDSEDKKNVVQLHTSIAELMQGFVIERK